MFPHYKVKIQISYFKEKEGPNDKVLQDPDIDTLSDHKWHFIKTEFLTSIHYKVIVKRNVSTFLFHCNH